MKISSLKKKLDKVFAKWVRYKETKGIGGKCVSCGKYYPYEELDAGHFISCIYTKYRWDKRNVHIQCRKCNRFLNGNLDSYFLWMIKKYGMKTVKEMVKTKHEIVLLKVEDLEKLIKKYE